ncbi:uncharacterized protein LOC110893090 [Helianthus annuus]|uniref:uncharacterized protein LOC110893090 n=1 Tax=Helianthus annuus TaxID=4232 RepID=UPI000B903A3A|nr:uncharacterized protein LOC110893090 [Helianthus annuus]
MAKIVEVPESVVETEVISEDVSEESSVDLEEIAAEVYYYQSEQEVLASSLKSIMPPNVFNSFAGYFSEPTTGSCPQYDVEKAPVEEIIDVSKEITEETLEEIADKVLMAKLKEVDTESVKPESVDTESVKTELGQKESDGKSESQEIKSEGVFESESDGVGKQDVKIDQKEKIIVPQQPDVTPVFNSVPPPMWNHYTQKYLDGVEAALNLKLRTIENELPESIDVTFSPSDTDNESQVIKNVVDQVLDEENDNSEPEIMKTHSENSISDSEEDGNFLDRFIPKSDKVTNDDSIIVVYTMVGTDKLYSDFEYPLQNARIENVEKSKAIDDFNAAKKLREETYKSTFVEYDKRICYRCNEIGHMAKQCMKKLEKPVLQKPKSKTPTDNKGKKPMISPVRILKRGESLKSEEKPKSTFEVGKSSKVQKTSKIYPKTKVSENQSWVVKPKSSVEEKKMENVLKNEPKVFENDVDKLEFELDMLLEEFPPIKKEDLKSKVKPVVPNVIFSIPKVEVDCDLVFGNVLNELPKSFISKWIMDSGASRHMTGMLALLYDVKSLNGGYVGFAGNQGGRIVGQ